MIVEQLILYMGALSLGGIGAWLVIKQGHVWGLKDTANHRSSHKGVVPKGGGIGILAAFLLTSWMLGLPGLFWIPTMGISLLSLYGDRKEISPKLRLLFQLGASLCLLLGLSWRPVSGDLSYLFFSFGIVFVAGTANYYNFMDGINGIAALSGIVSFGLLSVFALISKGDAMAASLGCCLALSCIGFLPFNMPRAKVFMGDVGSILLGFVFAGMVIWLSKDLDDFMVLCACLFPFYADELTTIVFRIKTPFFLKSNCFSKTVELLITPHRKHLYQILANEMRIDHWKVSVTYGCFQLLIGVIAMGLHAFGTISLVIYLGCLFVLFFLISWMIRRHCN